MKTCIEWFDSLPKSDLKKSLLHEVKKRKTNPCLFPSLSEAIAGGFFWDETTNGADFWAGVHYAINELEMCGLTKYATT